MNIRFYTIDGRDCLGYEFNGKVYVLNWLGPKGACVDMSGRANCWR